jgi:parallel beta-helix repeat protein
VGRGGVVFNGVVSTANFGIVLQGMGHHTVTGVTVFDTSNDGLQVNSPFCEVIANTFFDNGLGFYSTGELLVECEDNLVECEFVEDECPEDFDPVNPSAIPCFNGDVSGDGIDIGEGSQFSVVSNNNIKNFGDDGLSCRGNYNVIINNDVSITEFTPRTSKSEDGITSRGVGNQVINNIIQKTNKDGIDVKFNEDDNDCGQKFTGGYNIISFNEVKAPADGKGIKIGSNNNFVVSNNVESAQNDAGFNIDTSDCDIGGNRNYLADNTSTGNAEAGFKIEETNNNVFVRNTATDNEEEGFVLAVEVISGEIRGLANILAGNNASGNEAGRDFREKGEDSAVDCTQNAYIGNNAPSTEDASPSCILGEKIDLQLQDETPGPAWL